MRLQTLFAVLGVLIGCGDNLHGDPDDPIAGDAAPHIHIVTPARGTFAGDVTHVLVTGTVSDDSGRVIAVTVNNEPAVHGDDGTWLANVAVTPGTNLVHAIAIDERRNEGSETRAVVVGPMVALERRVAGGIRTTLSAQALSALGRDSASSIETGGLVAAAQDRNPVVDVGNTGCSYARASITSLIVGNAEVQLQPTTGGIAVSTVLDDVSIGMHLQWADSCVDGTRETVVSAARVTVGGRALVGIAGGRFDVQLAEPSVQVTGIERELTDVPDPVVQMLDLDAEVGAALGSSKERLVVPMLGRALATYVESKTVDVDGVPVDVEVAPAQIAFTPDGGTLTLDTALLAHGGKGPFVFVPNSAPTLDLTSGLSLAVADDAANQLLASLWSAGAFDQRIELAAAPISELYDSVQLELAVPPHVEATGTPLELTIGDWVATFRRGNAVAATVAIHGRSALFVVVENGRLRMDVSTPAVEVDVIGTRTLAKAEREEIELFALEHVRAAGAAAVDAIPLPSIAGTSLTTPWVDPRLGYLLVSGNVPEGSR